MAGVTTPSLNEYMLDSQLLLADTASAYVNPEDWIRYINRARREVAMRSQCIRRVSPVQGEITAIEVIRPGRGYRNPRVVITPPDFPGGEQPYPSGAQARAVAAEIDGRISNVSVEFGGAGYFQPQVHILDEGEDDDERRWPEWERDGDRERAVVKAHTVPLAVTRQGQEVYPFSAVPLERFPGVGEIFAVKSISFIYNNFRYSVPVYSFSWYQSYVRVYSQQYLFIPTAACQFGQGTGGSIYMYPTPSFMLQYEWDCFCLPQDMQDDQDFEALEKPWTECVPYFAAHLAYLGLQNHNAGQYMLNLYDDMCHRYSAYARPGRPTNIYGRAFAFT